MYSPYSPLPSQPVVWNLYVWFYVDAFQVQILVPKWSYLNSHSLEYMWLELALLRYSYANVQCSWHSTGFWFSIFQNASSMPGLGHSTDIAPSGIQYSRKPCECLDLDIQLAFNWELKSHLFKDWCFQPSHMSLKLGRWLEKLTLEGSREGHEDAYDVSCWSAFFKNLLYLVGRIWRMSHI